MLKIFLVQLFLLLSATTSNGFSIRLGRSYPRCSDLRTPGTLKTSHKSPTKLYIQPETEGETNSLVADPKAKPQGYMSSDLASNEDGKQGRVFGYILFALVPVLFLVPFFLSRGFEPPVDPEMEVIPKVTVQTTKK